MNRTARGALITAGAAAVVVLAPAQAAGPARPARRAADPVADLLEQAARAGETVSYRGTQMVVLWSEEGTSAAMVQVLHRAGQGSLLRLGATPQGSGEVLYRPAAGGGSPDLTGAGGDTFALLLRNYDPYHDGTAEVAGHLTDVVVVRRGDASPSARFWLDRDTRVVLRREVYDADGRTLHASAFIEFERTVEPLPAPGTVDVVPAPQGVSMSPSDRDRLRADGWWLGESLPDGLVLYDARIVGEGDDAVLHLSYSDGVSTVSLFEQRGRLDAGELDGWRTTEVAGAKVYEKPTFPRRMVWGGEGRVFTLVAECRQTTLTGIVEAMPHGEDGRGLVDRLGHGLSRVGSWFNPFG